MVIPTVITAAACLTLMLVGSLVYQQLSNSLYPSIFVDIVAIHAAKYACFGALGGSVL